MLRAVIWLNKGIVDTLCMLNKETINKRGQHKYVVWLEFEPLLSVKEVWHKREDGWRVLVIKSLKALKSDSYKKEKRRKVEN
jgi:hypothetical protein